MTSLVALISLQALQLDWRAPASCEAPAISTDAPGRITVTVTQPSAMQWVVELEFVEPFQAKRRLELSSCDDVRRATRVLVLLGLRGEQAFAATVVTPGSPPVEPAPPPMPAVTVGITPRAGVQAQLFTLAVVTPRFELGAALTLGLFELGLDLRAGVPARFEGGPTGEAAVIIWPTLGATLSGCLSPQLGRFRPAACAAALAEWWQLEGVGVTNPRRGTAALLALGLTARLAFALTTSLELSASVSGRVNVLRPVAQFDGVTTQSARAFGLELGGWLGWRL